MVFRKFPRAAALACALSLVLSQGLSACSTTEKKEEIRPAEELYGEAEKAMAEENYKEATRLYDEVERQHPYSDQATQAQLMSAYASYKDQRYDEAVIALGDFIELHPGSEKIDYAYYLKALCYYEQISDVRRDQQMTKLALDALDALTGRFPQSKYARDAALKKDLVLDHLAGKEMEIGRYYLKQNQINAAINRFRTVVQKYQTTTHVPEALHRLVESYLTLGLKDEATRVAAVLGHNYPGNEWYERSYDLLEPAEREKVKDKRNWLNRTVDSLL